MTETCDVLIIGAGICGLQLAALLSHDRKRVTVLEAHKEVGGRARVTGHDGFSLDFGIHVVRSGQRSALAGTFRKIGRTQTYHYIPSSYLVDEDGRVKRLPTRPKDFFRQGILNARDRRKGLSLLAAIRPSTFHEYRRTRLSRWFIEKGIEGGLKRYLSIIAAATLVNPDMDQVPVGHMFGNLWKLIKAGLPPAYPAGGWSTLFDELVAAVRESGEIRTSTAADQIVIDRGRTTGVLTQGKLIHAGVVVCAVPVQQLFSILSPEVVENGFYRTCTNLRPTAGISIDYCLSQRISNERAIWFFWDPLIFSLFPSNLEPLLAPPGSQIYTAFSPLRVEDLSDRKKCRTRQALMEEALSRQWPELLKVTLYKRVLFLPMVDGAEVSIDQLPEDRPGSQVPGIDNLFLVGDSIRAPGGGGDIGHESVHITYKAVSRYLRSGRK